MNNKKIWFEPVPAVGLKGVTLRKGLFKTKILYRDFDGLCRKIWVNKNNLINRSK
jgi:hypothetical protein